MDRSVSHRHVHGFGTIHGTTNKLPINGANAATNCDVTFDAAKCRYAFRFMNGASMRYFDPSIWSAAAQTCYTLSSTQALSDGFGACSAHSGGAGRDRVLVRQLRY